MLIIENYRKPTRCYVSCARGEQAYQNIGRHKRVKNIPIRLRSKQKLLKTEFLPKWKPMRMDRAPVRLSIRTNRVCFRF